MTFELTPQQVTVRDRARDHANDQLAEAAATVDRSGSIPTPLAREAATILATDDVVAFVVAVEELAVGSASVAAAAALGLHKAGSSAQALSGLRGLPAVERPNARGQLALAAVALGIGRAALDRALDDIRAAGTTPGKGEEKPHWVLADAATDLEAARLLTLQAAQTMSDEQNEGAIGIARLTASAAATRAVEAALRIAGAEGLREGTLLERLTRDARAVSVVLGTEEDHRAVAAQTLFTTER